MRRRVSPTDWMDWTRCRWAFRRKPAYIAVCYERRTGRPAAGDWNFLSGLQLAPVLPRSQQVNRQAVLEDRHGCSNCSAAEHALGAAAAGTNSAGPSHKRRGGADAGPQRPSFSPHHGLLGGDPSLHPGTAVNMSVTVRNKRRCCRPHDAQSPGQWSGNRHAAWPGWSTLARALSDEQVKSIVVTGGARAFSGGADIRIYAALGRSLDTDRDWPYRAQY